ncbi:chemotaxis-specific protein-glutamate methyltransferase CheB [Methylobacterium gnaphalii]|uniref:Protein-glutamate methylesterase/protein-glutamine glutaminase n=1 Tax=Methylobacterium gnaphalii TaxID=1010610 RepID=A0A512JJM1_9HYPH|nr:chemotaxis-specific protein-glutamate methyltransferase CheB [Methylobacterium gnaphalii]GEP10155.1 chemotaxis response regulator protein-glutamate methylesterase of group 2 operon [Methylobacterium gnaphalii]GJD69510.1 Protein-glutamate methylesterase/protein-glutamine glutaminase 2 [Methylobacterium gnaphalii]GLS48425.1 chemotaxis response regulator protein-glutamate methylesterase of group 2 operon [Methylobacterium gnaphalii]
MLVEDSLVVRTLLTHIVARDPRLMLAAAVASGEEALAAIDTVRPDVISMDIRLPGIDGLETTRRIMAERPTPIVVVADAVEDSSLKISMNALRAGALSVVEKPVATTNDSYESVAGEICTQLRIMAAVPVIRRRPIGSGWPARAADVAARGSVLPSLEARPNVLAIAASTGGPPALAKVLGALPADFPLPVLLVQHMGAAFMEGFASWLDGVVTLPVSIARDGERIAPSHIYVAPGDKHLELAAGRALRVTDSAPVGGQRPAATVLFRSVARQAGVRGLGILLTGMGEDGALGLLDMRRAGAPTIAEHESTAVVYGMPAAAVRLSAAGNVLALDEIAPQILRLALSEAGS